VNVKKQEMLNHIDNANELWFVKERLKVLFLEGLPLKNGAIIHSVEEYIDLVIPLLKDDIRRPDAIVDMVKAFERNFLSERTAGVSLKELLMKVRYAELYIIQGLYPLSIAEAVLSAKNQLAKESEDV